MKLQELENEKLTEKQIFQKAIFIPSIELVWKK